MNDAVLPQPELAQVGKELHRAIDFGFQVEAFLASEIGQFLIKRAEDAVDSAVALLKIVPASDSERIRQLQSSIERAESIQYWLADAIQAGYAAQDQLIDQQP